MKPLKVMTIVGTRPEIIKLSRVINELEKYTQHVLVDTRQNYEFEVNEVFYKDLEIRKPDYFLDVASGNFAEDIGNIITRIEPVLRQEKPDAVLIYGDTNSSLSVIVAKRLQIPVFHMEAGNRCFDQRVPEENNRKIIDHLADINMTISEHARRYLVNEGLPPERVIKVGSCMKEVFDHAMDRIEQSDILHQLNLKLNDYFVVSAHREDNVDNEDCLRDLLETMQAMADKYGKRVIVSTHPRTRERLKAMFGENGAQEFDSRIEFLKPFGFLDYNKLLKYAFCVLSDSGTLTEDASLLDIPAVTIRRMHERPEGMDVGTLIMCGLRKERVLNAIDVATSHFERGKRQFSVVPDYDVDNVSTKVVRIILSYVDYINEKVWSKFDHTSHLGHGGERLRGASADTATAEAV